MFRVLIAEDEMLMRLFLKRSVDWAKYDMTVVSDVSNGEQAWEAFERHAPQLILTDLKMPGMNGMELIAKIRKNDERARIVILTCMEEFDLVRKAMSLGVTEYIPKLTMTPEDLDVAMNRISQELRSLYQESPPVAAADGDEERLKEHLLKDFLFRNRYTEREFAERLHPLRPRLQDGRLVFTIMEFDSYEQLMAKFKDDKGHLIRMSVLNVLDEILSQRGRGEAFHDEGGRYFVLFGFEDIGTAEGVSEALREIEAHIDGTLRNFFNSSVTFGNSSIGHSYSSLKRLYLEAGAMLERNYFGRPETLYSAAASGTVLGMETVDRLRSLPDKIGRLAEPLRETLEGKIQEFARMEPMSKARARKSILEWLYLPLKSVNPAGEKLPEKIYEASEQIDKSRTLEQALDAFDRFLDQLLDARSRLRRISKETAEAIKYIEAHFAEEFSLQQVADHVEMSANYLGTLFKKETGMTLVEYLIQYRIDKAKELLLNTHLKSYEIAERVGFTDQSYFSRTFKKIVGCTSKEFRTRWVSNWNEDEENETE